MTTENYLQKILVSQSLSEDSSALKALRQHREDVEKLLRKTFGNTSPTIAYGGSKAKGTMIRESYDLDIICYFHYQDTDAGETLAEIYSTVAQTLREEYLVNEKTSALRLLGAGLDNRNQDFHIDIVPGRYVDDSKKDCFIFQKNSEKSRLKTNLDVHVRHIRDSHVVPAIRLIKLWKTRGQLAVKQFVLELLVIDLLKESRDASLPDQLRAFWEQVVVSNEPITVTDPANPEGNDLSLLLNWGIWLQLQTAARKALDISNDEGFEALFGSPDMDRNEVARSASIAQAVANVGTSTSPWCKT